MHRVLASAVAKLMMKIMTKMNIVQIMVVVMIMMMFIMIMLMIMLMIMTIIMKKLIFVSSRGYLYRFTIRCRVVYKQKVILRIEKITVLNSAENNFIRKLS